MVYKFLRLFLSDEGFHSPILYQYQMYLTDLYIFFMLSYQKKQADRNLATLKYRTKIFKFRIKQTLSDLN